MTKKKTIKYNFKTWYLYLFLFTAAVSLVIIWEYINNATIGAAEPNFIIPSLLGMIIYLFVFSGMAYEIRAVILRSKRSKYWRVAAIVIAATASIIAAYDIYIAETTGYLYQ